MAPGSQDHQIEVEMAAPLELRTPMSTSGRQAATECGWKRGDQGAVVSLQDQSITGRERIHAHGEHIETSE